MSIIIIMAVGFLAAIQPNLPRLKCGAALFFLFAVFHLIDTYLSDILYYVTAGVFDLILVFALGRIRPITEMAIKIQRICVISMILNAFGLVIWWLNMEPFYYDNAMLIVHAAVLFAMIGSDGDNGNLELHNDTYPIRFNYHPSYSKMQNDETTI